MTRLLLGVLASFACATSASETFTVFECKDTNGDGFGVYHVIRTLEERYSKAKIFKDNIGYTSDMDNVVDYMTNFLDFDHTCTSDTGFYSPE